MRILSGFLKGKKIVFNFIVPPKPTEGIVKESLTSIIRNYLSGCFFLDLFAGSGAVGLEMYSNGAKEIFFVENDRRLVQSLKKTIKEWGVSAKVFGGDYRRQLDCFFRKKITFDAIYIDPPYHSFSYSQILLELNCSTLLNPDAWVIIERHQKSLALKNSDIQAHNLSLYCNRKYGSTCLDIYRYQRR